jgi:hypothetical protein
MNHVCIAKRDIAMRKRGDWKQTGNDDGPTFARHNRRAQRLEHSNSPESNDREKSCKIEP